MNRRLCGVALILLAPALGGCGGGRVQEKTIEIKAAQDPLAYPRSVLQRYAEGQPLGSEVTSFPRMIEDVRKVDPAKGEILEKGLKQIEQGDPGSRAGQAKGILKQL